MSASEIDRTLVRLAHEILEKTKDLDLLAFIGIRRRGVPLAQRLAQEDRDPRKSQRAGRHSRHQPVPRRPQHRGYQARGQRHEIAFAVQAKTSS